ncbi:SpoIID/LytB domain protein [Xenococcus sp. PCC 7305]|uniref:SpoIID/LytB domain-containing protein n=1 Tax=Xenococcus sp. PCC 7305 TaxID=102125 RepID=UPI0002ACD28D|nr:SpoIID/LytB domain-containing protein [Xenococcus sp. PCC 7305]ELS02106.1 SpoIID/LytB domain protein [Xenococcus sp. PCC 7305]
MIVKNQNNLFSFSILKELIVKNKSHWLLSLLLWVCLILPAQAVDLRIAIRKNTQNIKVGSSTSAIIKDQAGRTIGELSPMSAISAQSSSGQVSLEKLQAGALTIEPTGDGYVWIGDRWYRGKVQLVNNGNQITAINHVDLEDYLYSVVGAEAVSSWPIEALKAQAVAARSYALYKLKTGKNGLYDLDTTQRTQVYKGLDTEYLTTHEAVNSTAGQIMTYQGNVILAAFHSSSGGHTENVEDIWTSPLPYLRGVVDYDHQSPVFEWNKTFSVGQLGNLITGVGQVQTMIPQKTTPQGRVVTMKVVGDRGTQQISGKKLRKILDLRSTLFRVSTKGSQVQVYGRGFGHGLGLSQWGAYYLAKQGINYHQILVHYYQNTTLSRLN